MVEVKTQPLRGNQRPGLPYMFSQDFAHPGENMVAVWLRQVLGACSIHNSPPCRCRAFGHGFCHVPCIGRAAS